MSQSPAEPVLSAPPCAAPAQNHTRWFKEEIHAHDGQLKAHLRSAYRIRDVDDVVQETYLRIWKKAASEPIKSAKAFLYHVARGVALNFLRKEKNSPIDAYGDTASLRVLEDSPDACEATILQERIDLLADALMSLPPRCREAVILHKVKGLSQKETATQLGVSERTVEEHMRAGIPRCLAYLRSRGLLNYRGDES